MKAQSSKLHLHSGMQQSLGEHRLGCRHSKHTRLLQVSGLSAHGTSSSALGRKSQPGTIHTGVIWQQKRHHWRQRAGPESETPHSSADQSQASSSAKEPGIKAPQSQQYDLLPLEELQQASDGATEGPIDSTSPSPSNQDAKEEGSKADPIHKALSFTALQWRRLVSIYSSLIQRLVAVLSWIHAVARHRKLAKLKAELLGDPLAPDK